MPDQQLDRIGSFHIGDVLYAGLRVRGCTEPVARRLAEERVAALAAAEQRAVQAEEQLARAAFVAQHLMAIIPDEAWRDSGGGDGQGHYEGLYRAEQLAAEIKEWAAASVAGGGQAAEPAAEDETA